MSKQIVVLLVAAFAVMVVDAGQAQADPISSLYSTGFDGSGNLIRSGIDGHYTVTGGVNRSCPLCAA